MRAVQKLADICFPPKFNQFVGVWQVGYGGRLDANCMSGSDLTVVTTHVFHLTT